MVSFGHTAIGAMIGVSAYNLLGQTDLASGLLTCGAVGFISHYIADFLPHGHFNMPRGFKKDIYKIIIFDLLLSIVIFLGGIYLRGGFSNEFFYVLFGIGGSQLPDVLDGLIYINALKSQGLLKIEKNLHDKTHWHGNGTKTLLLGKGDIWQFLVVLIAFLFVFYK